MSKIQELLNISEKDAENICKNLIKIGRAKKGASQVEEMDVFSIKILKHN